MYEPKMSFQKFCSRKCNYTHKNHERSENGYFRTYNQTYNRQNPFHRKDHCQCGRLKERSAKTCLYCRPVTKRHPRPQKPPEYVCPYCESEMRLSNWHGQPYLRCVGCGLETDEFSLRKIQREDREIAA